MDSIEKVRRAGLAALSSMILVDCPLSREAISNPSINHAPLASPVKVTIPNNSPILTHFSLNASDPDGDSLIYSISEPASRVWILQTKDGIVWDQDIFAGFENPEMAISNKDSQYSEEVGNYIGNFIGLDYAKYIVSDGKETVEAPIEIAVTDSNGGSGIYQLPSAFNRRGDIKISDNFDSTIVYHSDISPIEEIVVSPDNVLTTFVMPGRLYVDCSKQIFELLHKSYQDRGLDFYGGVHRAEGARGSLDCAAHIGFVSPDKLAIISEHSNFAHSASGVVSLYDFSTGEMTSLSGLEGKFDQSSSIVSVPDKYISLIRGKKEDGVSHWFSIDPASGALISENFFGNEDYNISDAVSDMNGQIYVRGSFGSSGDPQEKIGKIQPDGTIEEIVNLEVIQGYYGPESGLDNAGRIMFNSVDERLIIPFTGIYEKREGLSFIEYDLKTNTAELTARDLPVNCGYAQQGRNTYLTTDNLVIKMTRKPN